MFGYLKVGVLLSMIHKCKNAQNVDEVGMVEQLYRNFQVQTQHL